MGSEPELTPIRIGTPAAVALAATSATFSRPPMLPGLSRTQWAPASIAFSASVWLKWMSAITGIGDSLTIVFSASTSSSRGTATRTMSAPASATLRICSIVAARLAVSVLVIVCTATGAPPPIGTPPTNIWRFEAMGQAYRGGPRSDLNLVAAGAVDQIEWAREGADSIAAAVAAFVWPCSPLCAARPGDLPPDQGPRGLSRPAPPTSYVELQMYCGGRVPGQPATSTSTTRTGSVVGTFTLPATCASEQSEQQTILIADSGYARSLSRRSDSGLVGLEPQRLATGGAVCWADGSPTDCVAWGNFTGHASARAPP